jgi:phospholipase/carboxylesterase
LYAQNNTQLITFQNTTLRIRPAAIKPSRLLVLIHGLTGDENSMWVFVRNFPDNYWIFAPRGPYRAEDPDSGYSWWPKQAGSDGTREDSYKSISLEALRSAANDLISLIDAYTAKNNILASQFDLIGFSQGGLLANTISIVYPNRTCRTGILASFIPANAETILQEGALKDKAFFVSHGRLDEKVGVEHAHRSIEMLERAGSQVTYCEDEVGHKVSAHCLCALEKFYAS